MTHKDLVEIAYKWVLARTTCGVAFKELRSLACNGEYPDVIGIGSDGHSVLVECKISRSDFLADAKKRFRATPQLGMGSQRFYCCPTGLIKQDELPEGWGLVYVDEKGKAKCVYSPYKGNIGERTTGHQKNIRAEHGLMYSVLRRLHKRGLIDVIYQPFDEYLEEHDPDKPDCEACSLEHKEDLKHQPRHTCGKDGPNENHINLFKKVKGE